MQSTEKPKPQEIGLVLARGGSKGIKNKNIVDFCGLPLMTWTLRQFREAGLENNYLSTDSEEIAQIATREGFRVIERPETLAGDAASGDEAALHALELLALDHDCIVVSGQATSPLRRPSHVRGIINFLKKGNLDSAFSGCRVDDVSVWEQSGIELKSTTYDFLNRSNRQERNPKYVENGSLYATKAGVFLRDRNRLGGRLGVFEMPKWTLPEIDEPEDLELCRTLMVEFVLQ